MNMTQHIENFPIDKNLPLEDLLNHSYILNLLNSLFKNDTKYTNCKIEHIRYSPKKTCILSLKIFSKDKSQIDRYYLKFMNDEIYAKENKEISKLPSNKNRVLLERINLLVCKFPYDNKIDFSILLLHQNDKSFVIKRYKPETRFVIQYDSLKYDSKHFTNIIARIELPQKAKNSYIKTLKVTNTLNKNINLSVPAILYYSEKDSILIQEQVQAISFADMLLDDNTKNVDRVVSALVEFHSLEIKDIELKNTATYLKQFVRSCKILDYGNQEIHNKLKNISTLLNTQIKNIDGSHNVVIHGDFHQGQILLSNTQTWIIDLDSIGIGSPAADLGNFYAQLKKMEFKYIIKSSDVLFSQFIEAYQEKTKTSIDKNELNFYTACSLVELAVKELRRQRKNWYLKIMQLLNESVRVLQE